MWYWVYFVVPTALFYFNVSVAIYWFLIWFYCTWQNKTRGYRFRISLICHVHFGFFIGGIRGLSNCYPWSSEGSSMESTHKYCTEESSRFSAIRMNPMRRIGIVQSGVSWLQCSLSPGYSILSGLTPKWHKPCFQAAIGGYYSTI